VKEIDSKDGGSMARDASTTTVPMLGIAGAAMAGVGLLAGGAAEAATFNVTNLNDAGAGSLRQAIDDANAAAGADDVTFQAGLSGTITLSSGQLEITDSLTVTGPGAANLSVSGNNASRVFYLYNAATNIAVTLSGMTVTGGAAATGAGIINFDEDLTLDGVTISGNAATGDGGGLWADGFAMDLSIQNSAITGNTSGGDGGGVYIEDTGAPMSIGDTTISGNTASGSGGGIYFYDPDETVSISNSVISGNNAGGSGGAIYLYSFDTGTMQVAASTVSGNQAAAGGGLFFYGNDSPVIESATISGNQATAGDGGGVYFYNPLSPEIRHSTVAANSATGAGGGVFVNSQSVTLDHTLVGDNTAGSNPDVGGAGTLLAANSLIETPGTATITDNGGNVLNQDAQLGALADNGGPTQTHLPAAASPAVNAGDAAFAPPPATDQRGNARVIGGRIDIGSVEIAPGMIDMGQPAYSVAEEAGTVSVQVNRNGGSDGAVSVDYATTPGTALAGADYTTTTGTLTWASGDVTPKTIIVPILNDATPEGSEDFTVSLSNVSGATLSANAASIVTITDTDFVPSTIQVAVTSATVDESAGVVNVQVNRTGDTSNTASVAYATAANTALAGSDFVAASGTLTWGVGDGAPKIITVSILDDISPEAVESFVVSLSNPVGATLSPNSATTVSITDTDVLGAATAVPAVGAAGKLSLGLGMGLLAWLGLRRKRILQAIAPLAMGLAFIGTGDAVAANARPQAQRVAGTYVSSTTDNARISLNLAGAQPIDIDASKLTIKDVRRGAPAGSRSLSSIAAGTPVTVKTKFNADGSVRKVTVRLFATLAEAQNEATH